MTRTTPLFFLIQMVTKYQMPAGIIGACQTLSNNTVYLYHPASSGSKSHMLADVLGNWPAALSHSPLFCLAFEHLSPGVKAPLEVPTSSRWDWQKDLLFSLQCFCSLPSAISPDLQLTKGRLQHCQALPLWAPLCLDPQNSLPTSMSTPTFAPYMPLSTQ